MKKILVVDDEADLLLITLLRLKHMGHEASGAVNGEEALEMARSKMPDLIILDVFLPGMNGDEVAKILKKDEKTKHIPVLLISADVKALEGRALGCGAEGCLGKPFDAASLIAMVQKYIG